MDAGFASVTKAAPDLESLGQFDKDKAMKEQEKKIKKALKDDKKKDTPVKDMGQSIKADAEEKQKANIDMILNPPSGVLAQEADRAAMLQEGVGPEIAPAPAVLEPVPAPEVVPPAPVAAPPAGAVEPVAADAAPPAVPAASGVVEPPPQVKADPDWIDKIASIAKVRKRGFLDALQAGLYGFAGIDKETGYEKEQAAAQKAQEQATNQAFLQMMAEIDQKNADRRQELDRKFQTDIAEARNRWDTDAAERLYQVQSEEGKLNRRGDLEIAKERWVQAAARAGKSPEEAMKEFQEKLAAMYGGTK